MMPTQLFYNTGIPTCLCFLSRYKNGNKNRDRKGEVLFIDAPELGDRVNRRNRSFDDDDIQAIAGTYHEWKRDGGNYQDIKGFCKSATLAEIEKHNFVLTPGRYVGIPDEAASEISFESTMGALTAELAAQMKEAAASIGYRNELVLVTNNGADFQDFEGLQAENWLTAVGDRKV